MTDQAWRKFFVGREEELKLLHDAWKKANILQPILTDTFPGITTKQQQMQDENSQDIAWKIDQEVAHMTRKSLLSDDPNQFHESLTDYKAAIDILQQLRDEMGEQFPPELKNDLAAAHMSRGSLLSDDPNQFHESQIDYKAAIIILQQLRDEMGEQFPPAWKNDLAEAHMNSGTLLSADPNHIRESLTDCKAAIDIRQQLHDEMGKQFPPAWKNDLAEAHMNRGYLHQRQNHAHESLIDYKTAIDIQQQLRDEMGEQFPPAWKKSLAAAHIDRGYLLSDDPNHTHEPLTDYKAAIVILQQLRDEMGEQFPPAWKNALAAAHIIRGNLHQRYNHTHECLTDYKVAIDIKQQLRDEMGEQFPPTWKNSLAMCYYNFAKFLIPSDKAKAHPLFSQALQLATSLYDEFGDEMPELWMQVLLDSEKACKENGIS